MSLMRAMVTLALVAIIGMVLSGGLSVNRLRLDPDAAHIVPPAGSSPATVVTTAPADSRTPGMEGSILFIRLTAPDGKIVLDRPFAWPTDKQPVPRGEYTLLAYFRGCDGNCGVLSAESPICDGQITADRGDRVVVRVIARDLMPGSECSIGVE